MDIVGVVIPTGGGAWVPVSRKEFVETAPASFGGKDEVFASPEGEELWERRPADKRSKVFERFHRLDSSRHLPGNGLGLSLVRAVAELHGAGIRLTDNQPGLCVELAGFTTADKHPLRDHQSRAQDSGLSDHQFARTSLRPQNNSRTSGVLS